MKQTIEEAGAAYAETVTENKTSHMIGFYNGAQWQQEQDNKELAMWKLAVEKQEARCTSLRGVISDLQDKNKYSDEDMRTAISIAYSKGLAKPNSGRLSDIPNVQNDILHQFKKK
jgi:hypothetical protein